MNGASNVANELSFPIISTAFILNCCTVFQVTEVVKDKEFTVVNSVVPLNT